MRSSSRDAFRYGRCCWFLPKGAARMKATDLLKQQHRKVEALFRKLEKGHGDEGLVEELASNLTSHMAIEQEIFYPAIREVAEDLIGESFEEHSVAELALKRLLAATPGAPAFKARVTT